MDDTPPTVPSDLRPCTPLGLFSPTTAGLGSTNVSWFQAQGDYVKWCWTSPVRRAFETFETMPLLTSPLPKPCSSDELHCTLTTLVVRTGLW